MNTTRPSQSECCDLRRWSTGLIIASVVALALGALISVDRVWGNLLIVTLMLAGFGLGGAFFLGFQSLTGARWSLPLNPAARRLAGTLPLTAIAAGTVAIAGLYCYPWAQGEVAHGATFWFKNAWLSPNFFIARSVACVVIWAIVGRWMSCHDTLGSVGRSAVAMVLLALSVCLAGCDWVMSLEPLWFSTMFGVYQFAGVFVSSLAALVVLAAWMQRYSKDGVGVDANVLHDAGQLLSGFSCFWMYIWFSQYMLIWYVNIPEESVYFISRMQGLWWPVTLLSLALNWGIPFFVLLPRPSKRSWRVMVRISLVILVGRWVDLCIAIVPPLAGETLTHGLPELGSLLLIAGLIVWFLGRQSEMGAPCTCSAHGSVSAV